MTRCVVAAGSSSSGKHTAAILGIVLGLVATVSTAALAFVVYTRPEILSQRLPAMFGRRQGSSLGDVDYRELEQSTEHEPLVG